MQATDEIKIRPFKLCSDFVKAPSYFEILFLIDEIRYRYGFEADNKSVKSEWLFSLGSTRESLLFVRNEGGIDVKNAFKEGKNLEEKTRENALFLSVVAQFNGEISKKIIKWFQSSHIISGIDDEKYEGITCRVFQNIKHKNKIVEMLRIADLGIEDIAVQAFDLTEERLPKEMPIEIKKDILQKLKGAKTFEVLPTHKMYDKENNEIGLTNFDFNLEESEGTKKFFRFAGPILLTLSSGSVLVVDELDTKLHPDLARAIVMLFNSKKTNPHNAQLIFATHNTNLLGSNFLRRDQIWFTEKNNIGATDLYSLVEYKLPETNEKVRNDASFEKDYFRGRYGAVPVLGNLIKLFEE